MKRAKHTLAVMAFSTLFGCTANLPGSTPTSDMVVLEIHSTRSTQSLTRELTQYYHDIHPDFDFEIYTDSYSNLIRQLHEGQIDYFFSSFVSPNENVWAAPIARNGLVMITHPSNPVSDLTTEDVRQIYGGRIRNWALLGGENREIVVLTVDEISDTFAEFERLVMGHRPITANAQVVPHLEAMLSHVADVPGSIGYVPLNLIQDRVQLVAIDGILPTQATVANNEYPLRSTIFVIGRDEPQDPFRTVLGWIQSQEGQQVVSTFYITLP